MTDDIKPIAIGIDKLRIGTRKPGPKTLKYALGVCKDLRKAKEARTLSSKGGVHRYRYSVDVGDYGTIYVAFAPYRKEGGHPQFVFELNPNKLGKKGMAEACVIIKEMLGPYFDNAIDGAFVTLIDYFADYPVKMQELFIDMSRKESFGTWGKQFDGKFEIETIYLGSGGSDGQVRAYDKAAEERAKASSKTAGGRLDPVYDATGKAIGCRMRVEARRLLASTPLNKIHLLENPFARLKIAYIKDSAPEFQNPLGRALLDSARSLGWQVALKRLKDEPSERKYRRAFTKHLCDWWKPDEAAVDVAVALLRLGLFASSSFDPRVQRTARGTPKSIIPTFDKAGLADYKKANPPSKKSKSSKGVENEDDEDLITSFD